MSKSYLLDIAHLERATGMDDDYAVRIRQYLAWLREGKIVTLADGRRLRANNKRTRFFVFRPRT